MTEGRLRAVASLAGWGSHAWGCPAQALGAMKGLCGSARYLASCATATSANPCCYAHLEHVVMLGRSCVSFVIAAPCVHVQTVTWCPVLVESLICCAKHGTTHANVGVYTQYASLP